MRTDDPILPAVDVREIVWEHAGRPARPTSWPTYAATAEQLLAAAMELRDAMDAYVSTLSGIAARCHETPACRCGRLLSIKGTGRPVVHCSDACRKRAERARTAGSGSPGQPGSADPAGYEADSAAAVVDVLRQ